MRIIRIYQPGDYAPGQTIELTADAGQHVGVVLRMSAGDSLCLFSGDNHEYEAQISSVHKKKVCVTISSKHEVNRESPRIIHLAQAISKGERMEMVMQKAVELGVASISPIITSRSVVRLDQDRMEKKRMQWQSIAIAACEQSGRNKIPLVNNVILLDEFLTQQTAALKFVLHPKKSKTWRDYHFSQAELALLIGPEGGFDAKELEQIFAAGFNPLCLGPRVLRTETAAISALSVLQAVAGDL